ncbi:MAG: methyltransferase domain-containing protein [Pseudomonadota bacterium]
MSSLAHLRSAVVNHIPELKHLKEEIEKLREENIALKQLVNNDPHRGIVSNIIDEFLKIDLEDIRKIFSTDMGLYDAGTRNTSVREAWTSASLRALPKGLRLLDAGAGECKFKNDCAHLNYVSQDIAIYDGSGEKGLQTGTWDTSQIDIVCDIISIPEPDASFDAILCTEVLEHLPLPVVALEEMTRLLKPGGTLILTAPFWSLTHFAPYHYATGFNRYFYEHHLGRLGYGIAEFKANGNFFESIAQEVRRTPEMADKFSTEKPDMLERYAIQIVLSMMQRLSKNDTGSAEYLYFGSLVRALKA